MKKQLEVRRLKAWILKCNSLCKCGELQIMISKFEAKMEAEKAEVMGGHLIVIPAEITIRPLPKGKR